MALNKIKVANILRGGGCCNGKPDTVRRALPHADASKAFTSSEDASSEDACLILEK